jgi:large subunit ribosomal protein L4
MKLKIYNTDGTAAGEGEFEDIPVFEGDKGLQAVKEVIVAQAANARQGTASTKTRAEVSGGGKKPWKQKGTGRARQGSIRSPIWKGGGVVFGPRPRDYSKKINKRVKQLAFQRALYDRAVDGGISVIESLDVAPAKTKVAQGILRGIAPKGKVLIVDSEFSESSILAFRNLAQVNGQEASFLSVTELCQFSNIIVTRKGLDALVARAKGGSK